MRFMNLVGNVSAVLVLAAGLPAAAADAVRVSNAWAPATVAGQSVAGVYMDLTASADATLVGAASALAARAELHTMSMEGSVMKMRALDKLELPANRVVNLKPGGNHVMLLDLKRALKAGERVPLTLTVRDAKGASATLQVDAEVRARAGAEHRH